MADGKRTTNVVSVIEPQLNQLLGAYLQYRSLCGWPDPPLYSLVIIDRGSATQQQLVAWSRSVGIRTATSASTTDNPYLNRWRVLDVFPELRDAPHVVLLDWDVVAVSTDALPAPSNGQLLCRRNPTDMYRDCLAYLHVSLPAALTTADGSLSSSVNAGVIVASGERLVHCAGLHTRWAERLAVLIPVAALWQQDQIALSLAVGETGFQSLCPAWNVTPLSPVADADVRLWHYNDGYHSTWQLKRNLLRPDAVAQACEALRPRWPTTTEAFERLYSSAIQQMPFRAFLH